MTNIVNINKIIEIVKNKSNKNISKDNTVTKILEESTNKVIQEYGHNIIFIQGDFYDTYDKNIINETILKLLNKLGSFTKKEYTELKASIFEELRGGKLIIADIVHRKYINDHNNKKQNDYFNMNETYSEYLENETYTEYLENTTYAEGYKRFQDQINKDMCLEEAVMVFINSMGRTFQNELKQFQDQIPIEYKLSRPYNDIALGKAIGSTMGKAIGSTILDCKGNIETINTGDIKFNSIEKINTVFDLLCSAYSSIEDIINKSLSNMLQDLPQINIAIPYYMPEFKHYINKYNDETNKETKKTLLLHIVTKCKLFLTGDRIETLKLWSDNKNSIFYDIVPIDIPDTLIKKDTYDKTKVFNIFSHCVIFPKNKTPPYENETISTDPKYKYIGMICIKIENDVKVILVYKKIINLIQAPDYKFITPFDNRMDLSIIVDASKYHLSSFNSANYKLILSCYKNNQDITLNDEYDVFDNKQIPTNEKHNPIQKNEIHVYFVQKSDPERYLFSRFSMVDIEKEYDRLELHDDKKSLKNLQEIPFSNTMIELFPNINKLCSITKCITFNDMLGKQVYHNTKRAYIALVTRQNYRKKQQNYYKKRQNYHNKSKQNIYIPPHRRNKSKSQAT